MSSTPPSLPHSCFYEGRLWHRRRVPLTRQFSYPVMMAYLDLEEVEQAGRDAVNTFPPLGRLRRSDYLGPADQPLAESVRKLVEDRLHWRPPGPIRLLTNPRQWGFTMNPLSLFYCFGADGQTLCACVAEVTNTPWNQKHHYVLDFRQQPRAQGFSAEHAKEMHVSPFFNMDMSYFWRLREPGERLLVQLQNWRGGEHLFDALLDLRRIPSSRWQSWRMLASYPFQTLRIFARIHWQALRLWMLRVPYVPHPAVNDSRSGGGPHQL